MNIDNFLKSSDTNLKFATSEKIDLTKPEDVVLALGYAYAYMYHRADDPKESEAALSKYNELFNSYDISTGKPKTKSDCKGDEMVTGYRLEQLEKASGKALMGVDAIWVALDGLKKQVFQMRNELDMTKLRIKRLETSTPDVSFGFGCSDLPKTEDVK